MRAKVIANFHKQGANSHVLYSSQPSAGFPVPGDDHVEKSLDLNDLLIKLPHSTFFFKVEGDSMEGAKIFSGDILVVDRSIEAKDRSIVLAAVYGEMVVKRLVIRSNKIELHSENQAYEPIALNGDEDCYLWGVVVGLVRAL